MPERSISTYSLLENLAFLDGQRVRFGNDRYDVDDLREFLEDDDIDGLKSSTVVLTSELYFPSKRCNKNDVRMACRVNKKETAMDATVLDVAVALSR